ncbi:MAG: MoaD/ThiS family protein [Candidatus Tectomicrobia bacterium]|uniref:Molybdopterin synthase sulfur carrier subunit n=1 Tax=Tectimicrobiota bacterium TaxID=2528274 RepID=A0A937VZ35_UNCTE|nr:MoaD/ThiS family protein [Candidatus Tectomicrobia bacterium]
MQITVKLFALMREKAGTDTIPLEVPAQSAVHQATALLVQQYPVLAPYIANTRFSLHMDFVESDTILAAGDELVLIPPVSGGA